MLGIICYTKCLNFFQPKMSSQAQKFEIFEKSSLWVSIVRAVSGSSGVCTPHQLCLLLDLMLNAHANSNITCTQTLCPIKSVPDIQAHGTQFSGTRVSFLSLFFLSLFFTATMLTSRRLFVEDTASCLLRATYLSLMPWRSTEQTTGTGSLNKIYFVNY